METVQALAKKLGTIWPAIEAAATVTDELMSELRNALSDLDDVNYSIVVTGSLGRGEACRSSDADWMLLVDGLSDPKHGPLVRTITNRVEGVLPAPPGKTRTFGEIVASHDLIHYIAGARDTNVNLTRRMLLLAESRALTNPLLRERVIRNVLNRYVVLDRSVPRPDGKRQTIPHFLLNDVVRYWRTMASDYASKVWESDRKGWGLRNIKLRFSRKLLFIWGLLSSFAAELFPDASLATNGDDEEYLGILAEHIRKQTDVTPLELLARVVIIADEDEIARTIFSGYDQFLEALTDAARRDELKSLQFEDALKNETYSNLRAESQKFREALNDLFFVKHPELPRLIRNYGVF